MADTNNTPTHSALRLIRRAIREDGITVKAGRRAFGMKAARAAGWFRAERTPGTYGYTYFLTPAGLAAYEIAGFAARAGC